MIADTFTLLLESSLILSCVLVMVLVLRRPLRRLSGARASYALWLSVPLAIIVPLLPAPSPATQQIVPIAVRGALDTGAMEPAAGAVPIVALLIAVWIAGMVVVFGLGLWRQWRFVGSLGQLQLRSDGCLQSSRSDSGPAVIGFWPVRIVLPADFERRYDAQERDLVLRHERVHLARRDLHFNLCALALRSLHWFNPLVHLGARAFRFDQELAADAVVLAQQPGARRRYAEAMLKTQLTGFGSPLGCHWQSIHPLKERIAMLKRPVPGSATMFGGLLLAGVFSMCVGFAAWASQSSATAEPEVGPTYSSLKPPAYPQAALDARAHGTTVLRVRIDEKGKASEVGVDVSSGHAALDEAAIAAVGNWKFNPAQDKGVPVAAWIQVPIEFKLDDAEAAPLPDAEGKDRLDTIWVKGQ